MAMLKVIKTTAYTLIAFLGFTTSAFAAGGYGHTPVPTAIGGDGMEVIIAIVQLALLITGTVFITYAVILKKFINR